MKTNLSLNNTLSLTYSFVSKYISYEFAWDHFIGSKSPGIPQSYEELCPRQVVFRGKLDNGNRGAIVLGE